MEPALAVKTSGADYARMYSTETSCEPVSFNKYETTDKRTLPTISYTSGEPSYGTITADVNAGLRFPQARQLSIETYNSGCVNPYGCVSNPQEGFACHGAPKEPSPAISKLYSVLNKPYAPRSFELERPPDYVVGIKENGVNSVSGWQLDAAGKWEWQRDAHPEPCAASVHV